MGEEANWRREMGVDGALVHCIHVWNSKRKKTKKKKPLNKNSDSSPSYKQINLCPPPSWKTQGPALRREKKKPRDLEVIGDWSKT